MTPVRIGAIITFLVAWGVVSLLVRRKERRAAASLADGMIRLRRLQTDETTHVPRTANDAQSSPAKAMFDAVVAELEARGMKSLGDFMEVRADGTRNGPLRWFVDASETTCGWFSVLPSKKGLVPVMTFFSESSAGAFFYTGRGSAAPALAAPPTLTRIKVEWTAGLDAAIAQHHTAVSRVAGSDAPRKVITADDAIALLQRLRANTREWRKTQDPKALLVADAQGILGKHYNRFGPAVMELVSLATGTRGPSLP